MMDRLQASTRYENAGRVSLIGGAAASLSLVICLVLAIGWTLQCGRLKTVNDRLAAANETLLQDIAELEGRLTALAERSSQTIDELMAMNRTLGDANEGFAAEIGGIRKGLETLSAENLKLVSQIGQMHEDGRGQIVESAQRVEELTQAVLKLTEDSAAANSRVDGLIAQLQAKTKDAAEQEIRINTLVEMVARLRVLVGAAGQRETAVQDVAADPNWAVPRPRLP